MAACDLRMLCKSAACHLRHGISDVIIDEAKSGFGSPQRVFRDTQVIQPLDRGTTGKSLTSSLVLGFICYGVLLSA